MAARGGPEWIGAVVSVAAIFVPLAFPTLSRTARKLFVRLLNHGRHFQSYRDLTPAASVLYSVLLRKQSAYYARPDELRESFSSCQTPTRRRLEGFPRKFYVYGEHSHLADSRLSAQLCGRCKGRGKEGGLFTGLPLEKCRRCGGRGRQKCKPCAATGLANHWLYTPVPDGGWGPRGSK